jgi:TRAP-type C4-dicarboxylate transport system permease small subunit
MLKRLFLSCFLALAVCGVSFYLAYFAGLIYSALTGPANPANDPGLQAALRHLAVPFSLALGCLAFLLAFRRFGKTLRRP